MPIDDPDMVLRIRVFNATNPSEQAQIDALMDRREIQVIKVDPTFDQHGNYFVAVQWLEPRSETHPPAPVLDGKRGTKEK